MFRFSTALALCMTLSMAAGAGAACTQPYEASYMTLLDGPQYDVLAGDFDQDGHADLVFIVPRTGAENQVLFLRGRGDFTFEDPRPGATTMGRGFAKAIATDVNGDGLTDLLVANLTSLNVGELLGNGDGTFLQGGPIATSGSLDIAAADFNDDGSQDFVIGYTGLKVFLGRGHGAFSGPLKYEPVPASTLAAGELTGDGHVDVVAADGTESPLMTISRGDGSGSFTGTDVLSSGSYAHDIATADVDSDGDLDILIAAGKSLWLHRNDGGRFTQTFSFPVDTHLVKIAAFRSSPGQVRVAVLGDEPSAVIFFTADDAAGLQPMQTLSIAPTAKTRESVAFADFDGDGDLDAAVATGTQSVVLIRDTCGPAVPNRRRAVSRH